MPPFVYGSGQHNEWLLTEALTFKLRTVVDASYSFSLLSPEHLPGQLQNGKSLALKLVVILFHFTIMSVQLLWWWWYTEALGPQSWCILWCSRWHCDVKYYSKIWVWSGDGMAGRPWESSGNTLLALQYGSQYLRPLNASSIPLQLLSCQDSLRKAFCFYNTTDVIETCSPNTKRTHKSGSKTDGKLMR
jgi:hypothetical protein